MFSNFSTVWFWAGLGVSHGISQLRVKRVRGRGLNFAVPPRTAALHRLGFRQHTGTRISTISVKIDYRKQLNTLKLKCYFYMPFLFLKCLLNEFKCMLYCKLCSISPNKFNLSCIFVHGCSCLIINVHMLIIAVAYSSSSSPLLSLVTSTSEISHQPVHTYTTYIQYDKGGRQDRKTGNWRKIQHNMRKGRRKKITPRLCSLGSTVWEQEKHLSNKST